MTLHRFFVSPGSLVDGTIRFPPEASRQMQRVLRLRSGDQVIALDNSGIEYVVRLDEIGHMVTGTVEERRANIAEPRVRLSLYQGILKGAKYELVLQKGTEIGVSRFVPVKALRSVPGEPGAAKRQRYEAIVREASEQCERGRIPELGDAVPLAEAIEQAFGRGPLLVLWEDEAAVHLCEAVEEVRGAPEIGLLIGPEGGLSEAEVDLARAHGAVAVTMGPRILRAETAAIVGASLVLGQLGELG